MLATVVKTSINIILHLLKNNKFIVLSVTLTNKKLCRID